MHPNTLTVNQMLYLDVLTETEMHNLYAACIISIICVGDITDTKTVFSA